jgi:chromate transporter
MRKKFVEKLKWVEEKEMLDYVAIAQSAPGPIAINTSILVGFKLAGVPGALITVFGTVLPPLIVISIISLLYTEFRDNVVVNAAMLGMRVGIAAVLIDVVITMSMQVFKEKRVLSVLILVAAFVAAFLLNNHIVIILLVSAAVGAADTLYRGRKGAGKA